MTGSIIYGEIPQSEIVIDSLELAARLKTKKGYTDDTIAKCESELRKVVQCRYSAARVKTSYPREGVIDLGFGEFKSLDLYNNLGGAKEAFIFAVTIGMGVDRHLMKLYSLSAAEHFISDGIASALAEAACDRVNEILAKWLDCRKRFSPGYGDFPLELQPKVLETVNAGRLLGITLSSALLMTPKKSITAVMGINC